MKILLKSAKISDTGSSFNNTCQDILIENGIIVNISKSIKDTDALIVESPNLSVSQGWVDFKSNFFDPGFEHKETIQNGLDTAASGGFTHVGSLSSSNPIADKKSQIEYQLKSAENHTVQLHPIGSITKKQSGEELSEMFDMFQSGAGWFSDDLHCINEGILFRALLYSRDFGGKIIFFPRSNIISNNAMIHEGLASLKTGLKADPAISECMEIGKAIFMSKYTDCPVHISGISSKESLELIKDAKKQGLQITADVNCMNLCFDESSIYNFNTEFKVLPVLRSHEDMTALCNGIQDGSIDAIVSDHRPSDSEEKNVDFCEASFGTSQLQTVFSGLLTFSGMSVDTIVCQLAEKNRKTFGITSNPISIGTYADLTLFDPNESWDFNQESNQSLTPHSPFYGQTLKGKVLGIIRGDSTVLK